MSVRLDEALSDDSSDLDSRLWTGFARMAAAALLVAALLITLWIDSRPESRRGAEASCCCAVEKAGARGGAACPCGRVIPTQQKGAIRRSSPREKSPAWTSPG